MEISNEPAAVTEAVRRKTARRAPSKDFRVKLWDTYIEMKYAGIKCPVCHVRDIRQLDFLCGLS